jgi:REP element-mobilizing transposase RayT
MPKSLKRYYGSGDLHYITCSCYQRKRWLGTDQQRDLFLKILEEVRKEHRFVVLGYVVMPEHFHLLMSEPRVGNPSTAMQSVKQRFAQRVVPRRRRKKDKGLLQEACPAPCGSLAFTISMFTPSVNEWRSCGICIAIQ